MCQTRGSTCLWGWLYGRRRRDQHKAGEQKSVRRDRAAETEWQGSKQVIPSSTHLTAVYRLACRHDTGRKDRIGRTARLRAQGKVSAGLRLQAHHQFERGNEWIIMKSTSASVGLVFGAVAFCFLQCSLPVRRLSDTALSGALFPDTGCVGYFGLRQAHRGHRLRAASLSDENMPVVILPHPTLSDGSHGQYKFSG